MLLFCYSEPVILTLMDRPVIFITRSWHGKGGLQQLSHDLWRELERQYGDHFIGVRPARAGVWALMGMCIQALRVASTKRGSRPFIHVGDASLLPLGYVLGLISKGSLSVTACGLDVIYPARWYQALIRFFVPRAEKIVCISSATREEVIARGGSPEKTVVIPCGIQEVTLTTEYEPALLLTLGRLVPRKGVAWFTKEVMPLILSAVPDAQYIVCGNGPEETRIRESIKRLHLERSVIIMNECSDMERDMLMRKALVFVMPNVRRAGDMEGFGIVCIEASARGTPVVAARLEGVNDAVIEGETGMFFDPENAQECARVIIEMMRHPMDRTSVAATTQAHFSWSLLISRYVRDVFTD